MTEEVALKSLSQFGQRLVLGLRELGVDFEIFESSGDKHPLLHKVYTIRTPGFVLPEDVRQEMRDAAYETVAAMVLVEFNFDPDKEP